MRRQIGSNLQSKERPAVCVVTGEGLHDFRARIHECIAQSAYRLYEARGREGGRDLEDWFTAEAGFLRPPTVPPLELSREIKLRTELGLDIPEQIVVGIERERVIVWARAESGTCFPPHSIYSPSRVMLQIIDLAREIDPAQAVVSFEDGTLQIDLIKGSGTTYDARGNTRRRMRLRRTFEGLPDYYYCTQCGWVHTEAQFLSENDPSVHYHHEVAASAFGKHDCKDLPRVLKAGAPLQ